MSGVRIYVKRSMDEISIKTILMFRLQFAGEWGREGLLKKFVDPE